MILQEFQLRLLRYTRRISRAADSENSSVAHFALHSKRVQYCTAELLSHSVKRVQSRIIGRRWGRSVETFPEWKSKRAAGTHTRWAGNWVESARIAGV